MRLIKKLWFFGTKYYCTVCNSRLRRFEPHGLKLRQNARCPVCNSFERHRLIWLFLNRQTNLFDGAPKKVLHFAPKKEFESRLRKVAGLDYLTVDLYDPDVMERMDITDIKRPDSSFDVIYCSHVLEHVPDDRKAIGQLYRVLKPDGWALIAVPITAEKTIEDLSITDPQERELMFGQSDHLRRYGSDFENRLTEEGFSVKCYRSKDITSESEIERFGLVKNESVFFCIKKGIELKRNAFNF